MPHQGILLLSSSFWHLVEMLSQSISFFYSMPTKSFTMPYHFNKGKQKHRKTSEQLNQLFPGQRRPRKSRFNYKPRLLMERRASGYRESLVRESLAGSLPSHTLPNGSFFLFCGTPPSELVPPPLPQTYSRSEDGDLPLPVLDNSTAAHTAIALADLSSGMIISSLSSVPPSESLVVSWTSISMCLVAVCNSTSVVPARLSYLLQSVV